MSFIDIKDGSFIIEENLFIKHRDSFSEVENKISKNRIWDIKNDYKWIYIDNLLINNFYFNLGICFYKEKVESIEFSLNDKIFKKKEWNENDCLDKTDFYNSFLDSTIGMKRDYDWGSIKAYYDERSGSTFIAIRYKKTILSKFFSQF